MVWWQLGLLMLLGGGILAALQILRGRVAQINGATSAAVAVERAAASTPQRIAELDAELATVRAEWLAYQKHLDSYLEAAEDLDETQERRRRRAAARDSKAPKGAEPPADARAAAMRRAAELGYLS
jgi:hypothetical protein